MLQTQNQPIFIRLDSHRARERVKRTLGRELDWYTDLCVSGFSGHGGRYITVSLAEFEQVKGIQSVKRPRIQSGYTPCWKF